MRFSALPVSLLLFTSTYAQVRIPLPTPKTTISRDLASSQRDAVLFLISTFAPELTEGVREEDGELLLPEGKVPAAVVVAAQNSFEPEGNFNYLRFRSFMGPIYLKHRDLQHAPFKIPERLEDFKKQSQYETWPKEVVTYSRIKNHTRVIYRSPADAELQMRVALTLSGTPGDLSAPVRETEILYRRKRDAKNWDFYAFDEAGNLSTQSLFRNGPQPSPAVCMSCHYSSYDRAYIPILM